MTMNIGPKALAKLEVDWYRDNGKHKDRVRKDLLGAEYVQSDWAWNHANRYRKETIAHVMGRDIGERLMREQDEDPEPTT